MVTTSKTDIRAIRVKVRSVFIRWQTTESIKSKVCLVCIVRSGRGAQCFTRWPLVPGVCLSPAGLWLPGPASVTPPLWLVRAPPGRLLIGQHPATLKCLSTQLDPASSPCPAVTIRRPLVSLSWQSSDKHIYIWQRGEHIPVVLFVSLFICEPEFWRGSYIRGWVRPVSYYCLETCCGWSLGGGNCEW